MSRAELLVLRAGDERVLREWTRASSIPAGLAQRARILLLAAQGHSNAEIGRLVGVSLPTVRLWRGRYGAGDVVAVADPPPCPTDSRVPQVRVALGAAGRLDAGAPRTPAEPWPDRVVRPGQGWSAGGARPAGGQADVERAAQETGEAVVGVFGLGCVDVDVGGGTVTVPPGDEREQGQGRRAVGVCGDEREQVPRGLGGRRVWADADGGVENPG